MNFRSLTFVSLAVSIVSMGCGLTAVHTPTLRAGTTTTSLQPTDQIRVVVWNLHKESGPTMIRELREWIDANQANVGFLQEFPFDPNDSLVASLRNMSWAFSANLSNKEHSRFSGVLSATSMNCFLTQPSVTKAKEPLLRTPKPMLFQRCINGRDTITLINLHGLNFSPLLNDYRLQLQQVSTFLVLHAGPSIVAGDFNTWSSKKTKLTDSVMGVSGLTRVEFGENQAKIKTVFGNPLDHIYYTPQYFQIESTKVNRHFLSSDHRALFASFRVLAHSTLAQASDSNSQQAVNDNPDRDTP